MDLEKFKIRLTAEGLSQKTVNIYLFHLQKLAIFLGQKEVSEDDINIFLVTKLSEWQTRSINLCKYAIKKYCTTMGLSVKVPKGAKAMSRELQVCTFEEFEDNIIEMVDLINTDNPIREKALLYAMLYTGARQGEIVTLKRTDFDVKNNMIKLTEWKTKRERLTFVPPQIMNYIQLYFMSESEKRNAFNSASSRINYIFKQLKPFANSLHINLHPHITRHIYSTEYLRRGGNILDLQALRGDSRIETTAMYLHFANRTKLGEKYQEIMAYIPPKKRRKNKSNI